MDPITHTMTGAAISRAGLDRTTPLAAATLMLAANAPDIDVFVYAVGDAYDGLAFRRGWTHGPLAWVLLPLALTALMLAWDRWVRRRRAPDVPPARARPILYLSVLGVLTHPVLDWMNTYGIRLLMPFSDRWFYGDALFIIDPWVWLVLGGVLFLAHSRSGAWIVAWTAFALLGTLLMLTTAEVPMPARAIFVAGLVAVAALRVAGITGESRPLAIERAARAALVLLAAYSGASALANLPAKAEVRETLAESGVDSIRAIMIGPQPANPFAADVVVETPEAYRVGRWHWLASPRFVPDPDPIPKGGGPVAEAASATLEARRYLAWSRFPYFEVEALGDGYLVRIRDMRYRDREGRIGGVTVRLDSALEPLDRPASAVAPR